MDDFSEHDGLALAALVAKGEVTPLELVDAAIERIERHNPSLNAVVYKAYDEARKTAQGPLPDGPFKGVPFLIKDLGVPVAGWPRTYGSRFAAGWVDKDDCGLTRRYRESGVVLVGKTNTPEYGITGVTEGGYLGACRNPWNPDHVSGGSSGGAASAVASGMVPLAHASDGLGSIRIPAACCGLVGLKVTRDRTPNLPDGDNYAMGFSVDHVVTRTVRDSAAMLDATGRPEPGAPFEAPHKERPYMEEIERSPGKLRIAWSSETPSGRPIDPQIQAALERTAALLKGLGHEVVEKGLGIDYRALYTARGPVSGANFAANIARLSAMLGREPQEHELEPLTWAALKSGRKVTGEQAFRGWQDLRDLNRKTLMFFEDVDVYLCPVLGTPVPPVGLIDPVAVDPQELNKRQSRAFPYTPPFNFSGQPSLSLPLEMDDAGLPIGMMFTARFADEATLLRLAAQLEKEAPWKGRRPALWG
ncbi:6-aminohexanoate hydrolase [Phenylobacterium sp. Root77]|jgi:amidase|uniref:amidase n=1 Tax=unclassified Phenylobacterium TaxID=2640670 RepID=UPI0006F7959D|nr:MULTISPECIES: amidase [unclassified Phenylobacterium]KQW66367.1 6-aminohexanoate hydrolase [Phenylobacterium sp. Root1277]KQW88874.1 6-aminohexanoate hydrolase [Phenylobacterium sp. Root1290]KRC42272.1 6-aminohexanoate hydrolase [Phenylobacterium sp. Root77]